MIRFPVSPLALVGAAFATVVTVAASTPVQAAPAAIHVSTADLDLGSAAGQATLDRRLRTAAGRLCASDNVETLSTVMACRADVLTRARADAERARPVKVASN